MNKYSNDVNSIFHILVIYTGIFRKRTGKNDFGILQMEDIHQKLNKKYKNLQHDILLHWFHNLLRQKLHLIVYPLTTQTNENLEKSERLDASFSELADASA